MRRAALFVDDEQRVLDGLRRGLRDLRHDWDLRFALGGEAAVLALEPDLAAVVSDMRMPGLDGVDVLLAARERAPRATRVVLSGNSDRLAARRAAFVAHRFVSKPCDAATLQALLPSLAACVDLAPETAAFAVPPTSPATLAVVRDLLDRGAAVGEVAAVAVTDPGLTLTLLHAASSAFFVPGLACQDVAAAVEHLGPLVLAALVDEAPSGEPPTRPAPASDPTTGALAGLAALLPDGALPPLLELWGLAPALVHRVRATLHGTAVA